MSDHLNTQRLCEEILKGKNNNNNNRNSKYIMTENKEDNVLLSILFERQIYGNVSIYNLKFK